MDLQIDDKIRISEITVDDQDSLVEYLQEKQIYDQTCAIPYPYTQKDAQAWIDRILKQKEDYGRTFQWAIRKEGKLIGCIGFSEFHVGKVHKAEIGYWLGKPYWNQGIMTPVLKAVTQCGLEELQLRRVTANVLCYNPGSARVLQKAGYQLEGYLRSHYEKDGQILDGFLYAKVKNSSAQKKPNQRHPYIRHYSEIQNPDQAHYPNSEELLSIGSPFSRNFDFKKLGIHHELLPPGRRTSYPHAESAEEEFIYVIEGNPDVWINGELYPLSPGDGVGFPAGTGICHTFINNSNSSVRLLVVGEKSKPENRIYYPLNPERKQDKNCKDYWWHDFPDQKMGSHDGLSDERRRKLQSQ